MVRDTVASGSGSWTAGFFLRIHHMIKIVSGVLHEDIDLWRWCHRLLLDPCAVCGGERCDSAGPWDLAGNLGAGRADHRSPSAKKDHP